MIKSFRFLLTFAWVNLGAVIAFAAIVAGGYWLTGVSGTPGMRNLFLSYYAMFPLLMLLCLFLYAFALCTSNLNMGLAMGARRGDFFWALQGIMVFYTLVCWVLQWLMWVLPGAANWAEPERFLLLSFQGRPWTFPLLSMAALVLGCMGGLLMIKSKLLGTVVITLSMLLLLGSTIVLLLSAQTDLFDFLNAPKWAWLTLLPRIMAGVLAVSFAGGEALIWRTVQRYTVR